MPITPVLLIKLRERLGDEAMNELATVVQDLREADARLEAGITSVRQDVAGLRVELKQEIAGLKTEFSAELKTQISAAQAELIKWTFLFWVGTIGLVLLLLRFPG